VLTLLLHALPLDGSMWTEVRAALDGDVLTPTLYGLGESIEQWASEILPRTGTAPLAVVGNSVGGSCAVEIARLAPDRVKLVVLIGAKPGHRPEPQFRDAALQLLADEGMAACWPRYWEPLLGPTATPSVIDEARTIAFAQDPEDVARGIRVFHGRPDRAGFLQNWLGPVLLVSGESDPIPSGAALAASLPNATFLSVPDAGHYVPVEAPVCLASLLRDAISAL
jgi:pimeloyl-ACP methyl ester carboxylesterase